MFRSVSREAPRYTLQEAVHQKITKKPYKKGTYQQGHSETHITIFLEKVRQENVSTTYIFEKQILEIILANFNNFEVSKVLIQEISDFIISRKSETFSLPVCVSCLTFPACWLNVIICVSNLLTHLIICVYNLFTQLFRINPQFVGVGFLD